MACPGTFCFRIVIAASSELQEQGNPRHQGQTRACERARTSLRARLAASRSSRWASRKSSICVTSDRNTHSARERWNLRIQLQVVCCPFAVMKNRTPGFPWVTPPDPAEQAPGMGGVALPRLRQQWSSPHRARALPFKSAMSPVSSLISFSACPRAAGTAGGGAAAPASFGAGKSAHQTAAQNRIRRGKPSAKRNGDGVRGGEGGEGRG